MARPIRVEFPGAIYHVMSRGVGGNATYAGDHDRIRFLDEIGELINAGVLIVHAFCLMTNHFHMLCESPIGELGRWMHQLLSKYSRSFNRRHSRVGHLWQARYKAILIEPGEHFLTCSRYIHLNPVRAAIVRCAEEYVWSSYPCHLAHDSVVDWVCTERVLAQAGSRESYRAFVESGLASDDKSPFERAVAGVFFGDRQFVKKMHALVRQPMWLGDLSQYGSLNRLQLQPIECLQAIVDSVLRDWSVCQRRRALAFLLRRISRMTGREIAKLVGRSEAAASQAWHGIEKRMAVDEGLAKRMNEVCSYIRRASE